MLDDHKLDWFNSLKTQLDYILKEKEKREEIEGILRGLLNEMLIEENINLTKVQRLIQLYQQNFNKREAFLAEIFNKEESELLDYLPNINRGDPDTLEWIALTAQLRKHMPKGVSSPEIQRIIKRMHEKEIETYGDNPEFIKKLWDVRKSPQKSESAGFYPIDSETLDFFEEALELYLKSKEQLSN